MADVFANLKTEPYWWEAAPRPEPAATTLPRDTDVVVLGAGFSGLNAARVLARAGRTVLVCEADYLGAGASTRNGGMLGPSFHKLGTKGLTAHYGADRTRDILKESIGFVGFLKELLQEERIDCEFRQAGRFRGASKPAHFEQMAREVEKQKDATGIEADLVAKDGVHEEIGTDRFHGGVRYYIDGGLHPGKYYDGLVRAAISGGCVIAAGTRVTDIEHSSNGFSVTTSRGAVYAGQVAICTNGYTGKVTPWFRRRVLPIRSSMIATEPLAPELMRELMPTGRMYGDSRRVMAYYRPSPDGTRILFGGRATSADKPLTNARLLRQSMLDVFPQLAGTQISHSWSGLVAYAFDHVPHLGEHEGLYYAMGYCGSGVARASYFGTKLGHKMLGDREAGRTAFDDLPFESFPFYNGNPWFMPPLIQWHRMLDRLGL
jgi:glycine/D-amino acid oxidase-like deaminating enzyme